MFVSQISNTSTRALKPHYTISMVNTPFPNQQGDVRGKITTKDNLRPDSEVMLTELIENHNFSKGMWKHPIIYPNDPTKPAALSITIGEEYNRTLDLPPLVVPRVKTVTSDFSDDKQAVSAGYGNSCMRFQEIKHCYNPKNKNAVFVPGTDRIQSKRTNDGAKAEIYSRASEEICIYLSATNDSGCQNTTVSEAYVIANEVFVEPPIHPQ
jgi:hypothetical protein